MENSEPENPRCIATTTHGTGAVSPEFCIVAYSTSRSITSLKKVSNHPGLVYEEVKQDATKPEIERHVSALVISGHRVCSFLCGRSIYVRQCAYRSLL